STACYLIGTLSSVLTILLLIAMAVNIPEPSPQAPSRPAQRRAELTSSRQRTGFSQANTARIKPFESQLLQTIRPENCRREHRIFTEKPHMAGTLRNYELAEYVAKQWSAYGLEDVRLIEHPVYLPWPIRYEATLVGATEEKLSLKEEAIPQDKDSYATDVGIPYCAYSADVDVTAPVVYVNSGNPEDYDLLAQQGVDVRGKIALARY